MTTNGKNFMPFLRGFFIFLWTLIIKLLTTLSIYLVASAKDSPMTDFPNWAIYLVSISAFLFIHNSVVRLLTLYSTEERFNYLEERDENFRFASELKRILTSRSFVIESITSMGLLALACLFGGYSEISSLILGESSNGTIYAGLISASILLPSYFIIGLFSRYEVRRYWVDLDKKQELEKLDSVSGFILRGVAISFAYPIVYPFAPLLIFVIYSFFNVAFTLFSTIKLIGIIIVIILLYTVIYLIPLISGMLKRKKFLKKLITTCKEHGYTVSEINRPYRSFISPRTEMNFSIKMNEKEYKCAFVSTLHRSTWLCFISETDAYFRHRIGTKNHHFTVNHHIDYGIRGGGNKCIIISPLPKKVFVESDGSSREILPGDKMWDYVIYNMSGFINAIDRDCLYKGN